MSTYGVLIVIGAVMLIIGFAFTKDSIYLIRHGEKTVATITRIEEVPPQTDEDKPSYYPVLSYTTIDGKKMEYKCHNKSILPTTSLYGEVPIAYDPHNPAEMKVLTYMGAFAPAVVLGCIAAGLLFIGLGYFVAQTVLR